VGAQKNGIYKILMSRAKLGFQVVRRRNLQQSISYLNLGPLLLQDLVDSFILPPSPLSPFPSPFHLFALPTNSLPTNHPSRLLLGRSPPIDPPVSSRLQVGDSRLPIWLARAAECARRLE
jgi:hypothetical protein